MNARKHVIAAILAFAIVLLIGISGYMIIEGYSFLESIYMSIITITTVGFGEVRPLTEIGRAFTTILILLGFVALAFAGRAIVESMFERIWSVSFKIKTMKKRISQLSDHYLVCGYGRVGEGAVEYLKKAGVDFVIIESNAKQCTLLQERGVMYVEGDASKEDVLINAGIKRAKGLMSLLDNDPDNLFLVLTARELNPTLYIISRAEEKLSQAKILKAGADQVMTPYLNTGRQIAEAVISGTGIPMPEMATGAIEDVKPQWVEIESGSSMVGMTIAEVAEEMSREVYGLRRIGRDIIFPEKETVLKVDDKLLVIDDVNDDTDDIALEISRKLVIVDDNPVILHLFSRLFYKQGFLPVSAANGKEGLELIKMEKPVAAVIDYMLPKMSGIDLCSSIRADKSLDNTKIILFTGDEDKDMHSLALEKGADAVVVKSPDAHEVIETVMTILK